LFVAGCKLNSTSPPLSGDVSGSIQLYDSDGNSISSANGVSVTVNGSNRSTITNDSGKWTITDLPAGIYTFAFAKSGFGSMKIVAYQFVGGGTAYLSNVAMTQPSQEIVAFQEFNIFLNIDSTRTYNILAAMPPPFTEIRSVLLCIGSDSVSLSTDPVSAPFIVDYAKAGSGYDGSFNLSGVDVVDAKKFGFPTGTKLYAALCIASEAPAPESAGNYFDPSLNRQIYTSYGQHSQILSAVMP
jgi:hypothetical protein